MPTRAHSPGPVGIASAGAAAAGAAAALQVHANAGLGGYLGSPVDAAAFSFVAGWVLLAVVVFAARQAARVRAGRADGARPGRTGTDVAGRLNVRFNGGSGSGGRGAGSRPPAWVYLAGLGGALYVSCAAWAAPRIGVALVAVATVAGQSVGGLLADLAGLGPGGRRRPGRGTVTAAVLAVTAVALTRIDHGVTRLELTLLVVLAGGVAIAVQAALLGRLNRATGDPFSAGLINFTVGAIALVSLVAVSVAGGTRLGSWPADPRLYAGGICGVAIVVLTAAVVRRLGVLRMTVAFTAGQLAAGVLLDLLAAHGTGVTAGRVAGVITVTIATVLAVGRDRPGTPLPATPPHPVAGAVPAPRPVAVAHRPALPEPLAVFHSIRVPAAPYGTGTGRGDP